MKKGTGLLIIIPLFLVIGVVIFFVIKKFTGGEASSIFQDASQAMQPKQQRTIQDITDAKSYCKPNVKNDKGQVFWIPLKATVNGFFYSGNHAYCKWSCYNFKYKKMANCESWAYGRLETVEFYREYIQS